MSVEPTLIRANTTIYWVRRIDPVVVDGLTVFSASTSDGFSAVYELRSPSAFISIATTGSGNEYTVNTPAADTLGYKDGQYDWELYLLKSPDRWLIDSGGVRVVAYTTGPQDLRSEARKVLDAIDAMLAGKATQDVLKYDIQTGTGSRSLEKCTYQDLIFARRHYAALYAREQAKEGKRSSMIRSRFNNNGHYGSGRSR